MKLVMTTRERLSARDDYADTLQQLTATLQQSLPEQQHPLVAAFIEILAAATPAHVFTFLASPRLTELLLALYTQLRTRQEIVQVACLPFDPKQFFLVSNCPDTPHLLQTMQLCLNSLHRHYRVIAHPIFRVQRSTTDLVALSHLGAKAGEAESFIIIEINGIDADEARRTASAVADALRTVLQVAGCRSAINARLQALSAAPGMTDYQSLLSWLSSGNADFFACRTLRINPEQTQISCDKTQTLGLANLFVTDIDRPQPLDDCPPTLRELLLRSEVVGIEVLDRTSPLLRADRLIYLGVRVVDADGSWLEHSFIGLPSDRNRGEPVLSVPGLRSKIEQALADLQIPVDAYDYGKVMAIFNTYPKIELFLLSPEAIRQAVHSFTLLYRQGRVRVIPVPQVAIRGLTLLLIMPKEFYSDAVLARMEAYLSRYCRGAQLASQIIQLTDDYLSLHVNLRSLNDDIQLDLDRLEQGLTQMAEPWTSRLHRLLDRTCGEQEGDRLLHLYREAFPPEYQQLVHPRFAVRDILQLEELRRDQTERITLWGPFQGKGGHCRLQFYSLRECYLNELMPFLENLNLTVIDETDFNLNSHSTPLYIKSFAVRNRDPKAPELHTLRQPLLDALIALRSGLVENDYLNRLLVLTGLSWRQIDIFRGYRNYFFQLGTPFSKRRVAYALINNPQIALLLYRYFEARFAPNPDWADEISREDQGMMPIRLQLATALDAVADIGEDSILRSFFNLIDSTVRTNFYRKPMQAVPYFAFKISALGIIDMPAPRPLYEIFVHSSQMEGIHLRGGKVARGGIRWSDRPDDFRTEVLGLMKTQMTKNALIVPVGSKGGFIDKLPVTSREQALESAREAYKTLMRGLLDLTDNRVAGELVSPPGIIAYDAPDPYLVVAADKGTAHLPDTANAVSAEYNFWLGDAFASGGSQGYDHKALAITARGAWESVKRHFWEMNLDVQSEPFTVVGIGDMSGDVFGNGMLQSRQIRLLAAFDHRHIFLDPNPDAERSFVERQRLFALPRSSWADYDTSLISAGGGVWPRSTKEIPLSETLRNWLGVRHASLDGQSLIRRLLMAEVDLLWNGGIGTYVKASSQSHDAVGDRANDAVRIDAPELHAKVVGEGGNLGMTQLARIEYARLGGRLYTDAIDNSAGVDCSDHEVNLKILMQHLRESGVVQSIEERDRILRELTDEVCVAVLHHNQSQTLALSLDSLRCQSDSEPFMVLTDRLVRAGLLDRRGEALPSRREVLAREQSRLYNPELAILLAYSKMHLYQALLESPLPESPAATVFLRRYFPAGVVRRFDAYLNDHPLAREIVATVITNTVIDQAGSPFLLGVAERTGAAPDEIAGTYLLFDAALNGATLRRELADLGHKLSASQYYERLLHLETALAQLVESALHSNAGIRFGAPAAGDALREQLQRYLHTLPGVLPAAEWEARCSTLAAEVAAGLSDESVRTLALLPWAADFLPISRLTQATGYDLHLVAGLFRDVRSRLDLPFLLQQLADVPLRDAWDRSALHGVQARLQQSVIKLVGKICEVTKGNPDTYFTRHRDKLRTWKGLLTELRQTTPVNLHPFAVLADHLETFLES